MLFKVNSLEWSSYSKEISVSKRNISWDKMSLQEFVEDVFEKNQEELDKFRELQEILDQIDREETEFYVFSVTSDL